MAFILSGIQSVNVSGHTIIDSSGTSMTQRAGLQFKGMDVTDDSTNNRTNVKLPTPDYVDTQYNPSTTYSKGMTCISGNVRYRYINSTASSGHQPPNMTYWEVWSVTDDLTNLNSSTLLKYWVPNNQSCGNTTFDYRGYKTISFIVGANWGAIYSIDIAALVTIAKIAINNYSTNPCILQIILNHFNSTPVPYFNIYVSAISDSSITFSVTYVEYNGSSHTEKALGTEGWIVLS